MKNRKRIGILTSGGDCPGLNAVIRAVVNHATLTYNWEVLGIPSALDRLMATAFGKAAVDLVAQGQYEQMVAWQNGQVVAVPLQQVILQSPAPVDANSYLIETAQALGIYIGELGKQGMTKKFVDDYSDTKSVR